LLILRSYELKPEKIKEEVKRGVQVILTSNPRNPTGHAVKGDKLKEIMGICRARCTLVMDEFYSGYNYTSDCDGTRISCAEYVENVDVDDG
jgi:aspartate/methionine/tyrosine aminotransferase